MKNLILLLLLLPVFAFGQDSISYAPLTTTRPPVVVDQGVVLKLAPLSLIDLDPTIQVAVEIPLRPQWSIQQEVGYGGPRMSLRQGPGVKPKSTFRARTEIRYYFSPAYRHQVGLKSGPAGFYVAGEALYKQMNHTRPTSSPLIANGVLLSQPTMRITRQVYGMHAKVGYQAIMGQSGKSTQFVVDVYMGVGFRIVSVRQTSVNSSSRVNNSSGDLLFTRFQPFDGTLRKISLAGGIKLGWLINSGKRAKKK